MRELGGKAKAMVVTSSREAAVRYKLAFERYIEEQLSSILNQHRLPDEIVIVDDNSSDSTVKMIKEFFSKNLFDNVFIYENNRNCWKYFLVVGLCDKYYYI